MRVDTALARRRPPPFAWLVPAIIISAAAVATALRIALEAHAGFSLWDPSYLWYGVQRVLHGQAPIRDFMAYDPARYYWAAAWLRLLHAQGFVAVRVATVAFGAIGLVCAGSVTLAGAAGRPMKQWLLAVFAMLLCAAWMVPWWKVYDATVCIVLVASLGCLLSRPTAMRFLAHGIVIGAVAVVGRNHGLYGVVAGLLAAPVLMQHVDRSEWARCALILLAGIVAGYSPMLLGMLLDHAFAVAFWREIHFTLFEYRGTDLTLPVPWPWRTGLQALVHGGLRTFVVGCGFVALVVFSVVGAVTVFIRSVRERKISNPWFIACVATSIPYLNVAFSRADVSHLVQASLPCLVGILIWPGLGVRLYRRAVLGVVCIALAAASYWIPLPLHPRYEMYRQSNWVPVRIAGDTVWASPDTAATIGPLRALAARYVRPGGTLLVAPVWPGAYALLDMKAPVWGIYPLFPRSDAFQEREIARLQAARPSLVIIDDIAVDGNPELRYAATHPLITAYIKSHYRRVSIASDPPQWHTYIAYDAQAAD